MCRVVSEMRKANGMVKAIVDDIVVQVKASEYSMRCESYLPVYKNEMEEQQSPYGGYSVEALQSAYENSDKYEEMSDEEYEYRYEEVSGEEVDISRQLQENREDTPQLLPAIFGILYTITEDHECPKIMVLGSEMYDMLEREANEKIVAREGKLMFETTFGTIQIRVDNSMPSGYLSFEETRKKPKGGRN